MADLNVRKRETLADNSLKHYSADGVIDTHEKFKTAALSFERLSNTIYSTKDSLGSCWDGPAYNEFLDRFNKVFGVVRDLCDDLNTIQEMLNEVQLDDPFIEPDSKQCIYSPDGCLCI